MDRMAAAQRAKVLAISTFERTIADTQKLADTLAALDWHLVQRLGQACADDMHARGLDAEWKVGAAWNEVEGFADMQRDIARGELRFEGVELSEKQLDGVVRLISSCVHVWEMANGRE